MVAIAGPHLSRRAESLSLLIVALAAIATVIVPVLYVLLLPAACVASGALAPAGRRVVTAMVVWFPVSAAVVLGTAGVDGFL